MTTDNTRANRATYDRIAQRYADVQGATLATDVALFATLEESFLARVPSEGLIGDIGCGPALDAARFIEGGRRVIGADLSWGMLEVAAPKMPGRLVQADMRALPLRDRQFDGVWCVASLLHVPLQDTARVFAELARLLRPGGVLALITAIGETEAFEDVSYAKGERRWYVYRDPALMREQLQGTGFRLLYEERVESTRHWATFLGEVA